MDLMRYNQLANEFGTNVVQKAIEQFREENEECSWDDIPESVQYAYCRGSQIRQKIAEKEKMEEQVDHEVEVVRRVWDNQSDGCVEILPDADFGELVEIRVKTKGETNSRIVIPVELSESVAESLKKCAEEIREKL